MKILVLIKYSLDVSEIKVDPSSHALRLSGVPEKIGNIDRNAVEAGMRLKEKLGGSLHVLCFGPEAARESFRDVLAMGVDDATLIIDPFGGQADPGTVVQILEAATRKMGSFDLILCGFASDDGYTYQVGPRLAERLDLPLISYARNISVEGSNLKVDRDLDDQIQTASAALPALVSVAEEAFPPRRTTLMDAIKAKKKPVNIWTIENELGLSPNQLAQSGTYGVSSETGIVIQRKQKVFTGGDLTTIADQIIDALLSEQILKEGLS